MSREGVQRDILPIVEGTTVNSKYGMVRTDHILFIAAGAFHVSKPSDLIPELQGRFPIRVELEALGRDEFVRILTEPKNALIKQYMALLATEGVTLEFTPDAIERIAELATLVNERTENIGARRLHTVLERLLDDVSFHAPELGGRSIVIDACVRRSHAGRHREERRPVAVHPVTRRRDSGRRPPRLPVLASGAAGCGQKGPPLPPLRPCRRRSATWRGADRRSDHAPVHGAGDQPRRLDAAGHRPGRDPRDDRARGDTGHARATDRSEEPGGDHPVRPADAAAPSGTASDTGPSVAPGAAASHVEQRRPDQEPPSMVRHYLAAGYAGRRRGAETAIISVPLSTVVPVSGPLTFGNDETTLKLTWQAPAGLAFRVYEVAGGTGAATPLNAQPITTTEITTPVTFGQQRCFAVRTLRVSARVTLEGGMSEPQCVTPADTYPPAAPTKLVATPTDGGVELRLVRVALGRRRRLPRLARRYSECDIAAAVARTGDRDQVP